MKNPLNPSNLVVGAYGWVISFSFGAILLDVVYANLIEGMSVSFNTEALFNGVSDLLLKILAVTLLFGIAAAGVSWQSKPARYLVLASLLVLLLEFTAPLLLFPILQNVQDGLALPIGPALRLTGNGLASILALLGLTSLKTNSHD